MGSGIHPPKIFISAVTSELGEARSKLEDVFRKYGADPTAQQAHPSSLSDGLAIERAIAEADLAICLIGYRSGEPLPPGVLSKGIPYPCSWTQWEAWKARQKGAGKYKLFFYTGDQLGKAQSDDDASLQVRFRTEICKREKEAGHFWYDFETFDALTEQIVQFIQSPQGALTQFQEGAWSKIRSEYRLRTLTHWRSGFPKVYFGEQETSASEKQDLMNGSRAPLIATQGLSILSPGDGGEQAQFLRPAAFLQGRESEERAREREQATWYPVSRTALNELLLKRENGPFQLGGVEIPEPVRLFLVSGGGVGKTTNMRWLEASLNGWHPKSAPGVQMPSSGNESAVLAVMVNAGDLREKSDEEVIEVLASKVARETGSADSDWSRKAITKGLKKDAADGRLVVLADGLDHVEPGSVPFLISAQLPGRLWANCKIVAAGRPHAIQGWRENSGRADLHVDLCRWRFLEPSEFEPHESEVFLGVTGTVSRYSIVADQLGGLTRVPRVLEYVRTLGASRLAGVRTSADIYDRAIPELIAQTLEAGSETTRKIGPEWEKDYKSKSVPPDQLKHIMKLLSALAFLSLCQTTDSETPVESGAYKLDISPTIRKQLCERLAQEGGQPYPPEALEQDLRALAGFASVIGNGVFDAAETEIKNLESLVWSNRTIQQFLAAYWLAVHARGFDEFVKSLRGETSALSASHPDLDTSRLRRYVFFPEDSSTDTTYDLNVFLAEMPAPRPSAWVASASAWYDPQLRSAGCPERRWSSEMLYRSWATMHGIAGYPYDDWWDLPYEKLTTRRPGRERAKASVHAGRDVKGLASEIAPPVARQVLHRFFSDFENILSGAQGPEKRATAQEMIAGENWIPVPEGSFRMGAPAEKQGFPPKVKAYWQRDLDYVQSGRLPAEAVARQSTKKEWFLGAQGRRLQERDIRWLSEVFRLVEPQTQAKAGNGSGLTQPARLSLGWLTGRLKLSQRCQNRNSPAYRRALKLLETNWSRRDETPAEEVQWVAPFTMHRLPVLHSWYYLFSPGHRAAVDAYLQDIPHPADDHPAIYISWFDAWAFCQWAVWTEADPAHPGKHRKYGLRLPHEPEWEYAARWTKDNGGMPRQAPYGQRYWWGDTFYQHEQSPEEEPLSTDVAHARGSPGSTRAPAKAAPNGLGFQDILGNVWEWTANIYDTRKEEDTTGVEIMKYSRHHPAGRPPVNCTRTMRGGLWYYLDLLANSSARFRLTCDDRDYKMGFRAVREER
ncbi:MAG: formylglycine-generating enzyme family protein [Rhodomicrobium sp.]